MTGSGLRGSCPGSLPTRRLSLLEGSAPPEIRNRKAWAVGEPVRNGTGTANYPAQVLDGRWEGRSCGCGRGKRLPITFLYQGGGKPFQKPLTFHWPGLGRMNEAITGTEGDSKSARLIQGPWVGRAPLTHEKSGVPPAQQVGPPRVTSHATHAVSQPHPPLPPWPSLRLCT